MPTFYYEAILFLFEVFEMLPFHSGLQRTTGGIPGVRGHPSEKAVPIFITPPGRGSTGKIVIRHPTQKLLSSTKACWVAFPMQGKQARARHRDPGMKMILLTLRGSQIWAWGGRYVHHGKMQKGYGRGALRRIFRPDCVYSDFLWIREYVTVAC